ncbi:STAS domain-containing protein [Calidifontibacillus oryziterrae]|uniref:STAS domain-containing protein n=1 Tax=Calidifontibacillus oryziterrae TaxID=1191699 RepID=UPI00031E25E0|nr:STAS domain-containing protein [Calidifontibacillus oryziterrae]
MNLEINIELLDNTHLLKLSGEVDAYTAPKLREAIIPLVEKENANVIVNLSGVRYMDSTGLGVFIGALKSSYKFRSSLKLQGLTTQVERLFHITGLSEVINIEAECGVRGEK